MREYGVISPRFWIGDTGKQLRGNPEAQIVAMYLMTSPHANMIGVFYCPIDYIAKETGLGLEGASKGLRSLIDAGFCQFDEFSEEVFVTRMAAYQIGDRLDAKDNRCKGVLREVEKVGSLQLKQAFSSLYSSAFHLPVSAPVEAKKTSPSEAPSKPLRSQKQEQKQEQEQEQEVDAPPSAAPDQPDRGSRLPKDWDLPGDWRTWCEANRPDLDASLTAETFRDFWVSKPGKDGRKSDWFATWRNWCRSQKVPFGQKPSGGASPLAGAI